MAKRREDLLEKTLRSILRAMPETSVVVDHLDLQAKARTVLDSGTSLSKNTLTDVLFHILSRTLRFGQIEDSIRIKHIINGMPSVGINGVDRSSRHIMRALTVLEKCGYIVKIGPPSARKIRINVLKLVADLLDSWYSPELTRVERQKADRLRERLEVVRALLEAEDEEMAKSLKDSVDNAAKRAKAQSAKKASSKARRPFFKPDGSPDVSAALAYYGLLLQEVTNKPVMIVDFYDKTMKRGMEWFLKLMSSSGFTEDDIRSALRLLTHHWNDLFRDKKTFLYHEMSKDGKAYSSKVTLPDVPNFRVFYIYRSELLQLLIDRLVAEGVVVKRESVSVNRVTSSFATDLHNPFNDTP